MRPSLGRPLALPAVREEAEGAHDSDREHFEAGVLHSHDRGRTLRWPDARSRIGLASPDSVRKEVHLARLQIIHASRYPDLILLQHFAQDRTLLANLTHHSMNIF